MKNSKSLTLLEVGHQDCSNMHSWSGVRSIYVLHYIERGKGTLTVKGKKYPLSKGQVFLVRAGVLTEYHPSKDDPYVYKWVGFDGSMVDRLLSSTSLADNPVTSAIPQLEALFDLARNQGRRFTACSPHLLQIFAMLVELCPNADDLMPLRDVAAIAHDYILARLHKSDLRVQQVADVANISRSCLFRAFKERYGMSPMQFIEQMRMQNACRMLESGYSVKLVAEACGYDDPLYFSACFKRIKGVSPATYRRKKQTAEETIGGEN